MTVEIEGQRCCIPVKTTNVMSQQLPMQKKLTLGQKKALCMLYKLTEGTKEKC